MEVSLRLVVAVRPFFAVVSDGAAAPQLSASRLNRRCRYGLLAVCPECAWPGGAHLQKFYNFEMHAFQELGVYCFMGEGKPKAQAAHGAAGCGKHVNVVHGAAYNRAAFLAFGQGVGWCLECRIMWCTANQIPATAMTNRNTEGAWMSLRVLVSTHTTYSGGGCTYPYALRLGTSRAYCRQVQRRTLNLKSSVHSQPQQQYVVRESHVLVVRYTSSSHKITQRTSPFHKMGMTPCYTQTVNT